MGSLRAKGAVATTGAFLLLISACIWLTTVLAIPLFLLWDRLADLSLVAGMGHVRLMRNFLALMRYLYTPGSGRVMLPDFPVSASGAAHFADVQHLFLLNLLVLVLLAWPVGRLIRRRIQNHTLYVWVRPAQVAIMVVVALVLGMVVNFDAVFIGFHKLLFRNQDWMFDPMTDPIINILPEGYFAACFVIALVAFLASLFFVIYRGRQDARRH